MNPEVFTPKYSLKFYIINIVILIFGAFCLSGIFWDHEMSLVGKIGLALLGGLCLSLAILLLFGSMRGVQLTSNGILVKRPWRTDMSFRYDQLSAIDRDKISFVDRAKNPAGDALVIPLSLFANGDELIKLFQKGMEEGRIPTFHIESPLVAKVRAKKESRELASAYLRARFRFDRGDIVRLLVLLGLAGFAYMLILVTRRWFGVELDFELAFIAVAILAVAMVMVFIFGMADWQVEDVKQKIRSALLGLTVGIVYIISCSFLVFLIDLLFGLNIVVTLLLVLIGGWYLTEKITERLPWMK